MTTDTKLLPLPEWMSNYTIPADGFENDEDVMLDDRMRDYARANVAHATAPLQAGIEALRVEVAAQRTRADAMAGEAIKHEARAEQLAEA